MSTQDDEQIAKIYTEGWRDSLSRGVKGNLAGLKAGAGAALKGVTTNLTGGVAPSVSQSFQQAKTTSIKGDINTSIQQFKTNVGKMITDLQNDLKIMKFNVEKYPELNTELQHIYDTLQKQGVPAPSAPAPTAPVPPVPPTAP